MTKKDPKKTSFNKEVLSKYTPEQFQKYFEKRYSGDWKYWYKKLGGKLPESKKKEKISEKESTSTSE